MCIEVFRIYFLNFLNSTNLGTQILIDFIFFKINVGQKFFYTKYLKKLILICHLLLGLFSLFYKCLDFKNLSAKTFLFLKVY